MKTRFVKFSDSTAAECRHSEYVAELFSDWEIIWDESRCDYQGTVRFLAHKDGKFAYLEYSYGSCGGCDSWEGMAEDEVRADFKRMAEHFDNVVELQKFANQVNYGKDFEKAVYDYAFHEQLEKKLME